jgi:hypothetical protein
MAETGIHQKRHQAGSQPAPLVLNAIQAIKSLKVELASYG